MPGELLPTVVSSLCDRISRNDVLKNEHYGLVVSIFFSLLNTITYYELILISLLVVPN